MCSVILYYFACAHYFKLRKSRCQGNRLKFRRDRRQVACSAAPYIDIKLPFDCGRCQQTEWDAAWTRKLTRARAFLGDLPKKRESDSKNEGGTSMRKVTAVISDLVKKLEGDHDDLFWDLRTQFPPSDKQPIRRVKAKPEEERKPKGLSKLSGQIRPEDIRDDEGVATYDHGDDVHADAGFATYENPVYTHGGVPWIDEMYPSENPEEAQQRENLFDFSTSGWAADDEEQDEEETTEHAMPLGSGARDAGPSSSSSKSISMGTEQDIDHGMDALIKDFWTAVNLDPDPRPEPQEVTAEHRDPTTLQDDIPLLDASTTRNPVRHSPRTSPQIYYLRKRIAETHMSDPKYHALWLEMRRYEIWDLENMMPEPRPIMFPTQPPSSRN
jgi:hypothetical protein